MYPQRITGYYKYSARYSTSEVLLIIQNSLTLVVGGTLSGIVIWSLHWKLTIYTVFMSIKMDPAFFVIPAAVLCIPSIYLTKLLKQNKLNHIVTLITIQIIAIILLFTGYGLDMIYTLKYSNETLNLQSTIPTYQLNYTLYEILNNYNETNNEVPMDLIQGKFYCCGVFGKEDYNNVIIPKSCYVLNNCNAEIYTRSCLRTIQENVAWQKNITSSFIQLFLLLYFFHMVMVLCVFTSDHYKWIALKRSINNEPQI